MIVLWAVSRQAAGLTGPRVTSASYHHHSPVSWDLKTSIFDIGAPWGCCAKALYRPLCLWGVSPLGWSRSGECGDRTRWQCSRLLTCLEAHVSPFSDASAAMFSDKLETSQLPTHPGVALQTGPADGQRALLGRELEMALFSLDLNRRGQKEK